MGQKKKSHGWIWLLLLVMLGGVGYYLYTALDRNATTKNVVPKGAEDKETARGEGSRMIAEKEAVNPVETMVEESPARTAPKEEDYCTRIEKDVDEYFRYLDEKQYFKQLTPQRDAYTQFKSILRRCAERPPVPAGEGADPTIIVRNLYHFARVLDRKDLSLIRAILKNEQDTMEITLEMFYRWITSSNRCPDPQHLRPSRNILYRYAGFFLNTIGGRAYMFRRPSSIRLIVSYYCVLILHDADKKGKNNDGIDIFPLIAPLKSEISYYPDLQFQAEYIEQLEEIAAYYRKKRQPSL